MNRPDYYDADPVERPSPVPYDYRLPVGEAVELPADAAWEQWTLAVNLLEAA